MKYLIKKYFIFAFSAHVLTLMVPAFTIKGAWQEFFSSIFLLTAFFVIVKPLTTILLFPIHMITMNLSAWIVQALLVYVWVVIDPHVAIAAWDFPGIFLGFFSIGSAHLPYWLSAIFISFLLPGVMYLTTMVLD